MRALLLATASSYCSVTEPEEVRRLGLAPAGGDCPFSPSEAFPSPTDGLQTSLKGGEVGEPTSKAISCISETARGAPDSYPSLVRRRDSKPVSKPVFVSVFMSISSCICCSNSSCEKETLRPLSLRRRLFSSDQLSPLHIASASDLPVAAPGSPLARIGTLSMVLLLLSAPTVSTLSGVN